jgi:hypothetical protein
MTIKYLPTKAALAKVTINRRTFKTGVSKPAIGKLEKQGLLVWIQVDGKRMIDLLESEKNGVLIDWGELERQQQLQTIRQEFIFDPETYSECIMTTTLLICLREFEKSEMSQKAVEEVMISSIRDYIREFETGIPMNSEPEDDELE